MAVIDNLKRAWNAFRSPIEPAANPQMGGSVTYGGSSPSRPRLRIYNERTIISSIYTRISIDVAGIIWRHIMLDEKDRYLNDVESELNRCLKIEANLDQGARAFRQDIVLTLLDKGVAAIVPVDSIRNDLTREIVDVQSLRVGEVVNWYPKHVRVSVYNEEKGERQEITMEKRFVAIVENPFYAVMNEPNSTLQRLIRKLTLLDAVDEASSSGKLDMIIQLPYVIKSDARRQQAEARREQIEMQLKGSTYGIAYTDGTEKITQLNRPTENNLLKQVEFLTTMLYSQLGITDAVMNGTADEATMLNYINRTVEPILDAIVEAEQRTFLRTKLEGKERLAYFSNPFKLVPLSQLADVVDKFARNEVLASNEIRGYMGVVPSTDPKADKLQNSNMPQPPDVQPADTQPAPPAA